MSSFTDYFDDGFDDFWEGSSSESKWGFCFGCFFVCCCGWIIIIKCFILGGCGKSGGPHRRDPFFRPTRRPRPRPTKRPKPRPRGSIKRVLLLNGLDDGTVEALNDATSPGHEFPLFDDVTTETVVFDDVTTNTTLVQYVNGSLDIVKSERRNEKLEPDYRFDGRITTMRSNGLSTLVLRDGYGEILTRLNQCFITGNKTTISLT